MPEAYVRGRHVGHIGRFVRVSRTGELFYQPAPRQGLSYGRFTSPYSLLLMEPTRRGAKKVGQMSWANLERAYSGMMRGDNRSYWATHASTIRRAIRKSLKVHKSRGPVAQWQTYLHQRAMRHPLFLLD